MFQLKNRCRIVYSMFLIAAFSLVKSSVATADAPIAARPLAQNNVLHLTQNSRTAYVIALANDAIPAEKTAAQQLQKYLQQVTGTALPILTEDKVNAGTPQILVGAGERVKVLLPHQDWKSLGSDGIVIQTVGNDLILAGGRPRGALYAVFQFLEDSVGCRWWTPTESTIPHQSTLNIPAQDIVYIPPFSYRDLYTSSVRENQFFATVMRQNGHSVPQKEEWGGHYTILGGVHTFSKLLPPEKYFKDHPDWYSDPLNGNKPCTASSKMPGAQETQLCVSNPEVVDELTKQALAWIAKNPNAGYISISQNDNANYCQDPASVQLAESEGSPAGPILNFVNQVAERIHQQYPNFKVITLAYGGTIKPPKNIRPAKNVIIQFADTSTDYGHPQDSDWNKKTQDDLLGWSKISSQLFVWNYAANFSNLMLPYPNWDGLAKDLRFFAANKVTSVFEQGDDYTNGVGDFVQLRAWLISKLMWNPNLDQTQLTDEFLQGYYGAAAPYLKQYLDLIEQSFLAQHRTLTTFSSDYSFLNLDTVNKSIQLWNQAADAVKDNEILSRRVRRERLSLDIAVLSLYRILQRTAAREHKQFLGPQDPKAAMEEFIKTAQSFGIKNFTEGGSFANKIPELESMFSEPLGLPDFAKKYPADDVIDLQPNKYRLYLKGYLSDIVNDPNASGGKAATVVGDTIQWAITAPLGHFLGAFQEKWHIYAFAKIDLKAGVTPTGTAFQSGVYDYSNRQSVGSVNIPLSSFEGKEYQKIDLGTYPLTGGMTIWFAPVKNPAVEKIYIDRILLIHETPTH